MWWNFVDKFGKLRTDNLMWVKYAMTSSNSRCFVGLFAWDNAFSACLFLIYLNDTIGTSDSFFFKFFFWNFTVNNGADRHNRTPAHIHFIFGNTHANSNSLFLKSVGRKRFWMSPPFINCWHVCVCCANEWVSMGGSVLSVLFTFWDNFAVCLCIYMHTNFWRMNWNDKFRVATSVVIDSYKFPRLFSHIQVDYFVSWLLRILTLMYIDLKKNTPHHTYKRGLQYKMVFNDFPLKQHKS